MLRYPRLREIMDLCIFLFKPDHEQYCGLAFTPLDNFSNYFSKILKNINDFTNQLSLFFESLGKEFPGEKLGISALFNITFAIKLSGKIDKIARNPEEEILNLCSFQNYLHFMDFQFMHLLDLYFENSPKLLVLLQQYVNFSEEFNNRFEWSPSFKNVICLRLLHEMHKKSGSEKYLEKLNEIFENLKKTIREKLGISWRIKNIKKLEETMGEKDKLSEHLKCSKTLLIFLEECEKNEVIALDLKKLMEEKKIECPIAIKALFFWDLDPVEIFKELKIPVGDLETSESEDKN